MKKICFFTATRAEYGLLKPLLLRFQSDPRYELQIVVTGTHLVKEFGYTYQSIIADGFSAAKRIEMLLASDTKAGICKAMGLLQISLAESLDELRPDIAVLLGDRFEMLTIASCLLVYNIPIVHIAGGEITEGAIDDAVRHSLTKMSHLHFAETEEYRKRIIQLGEEPKRVFWVGSLGVENIRTMKLLSKSELETRLGFSIDDSPLILVTYHPTTLEEDSLTAFENLLSVLSRLETARIVFTKANADYQGPAINSRIDAYVAAHSDRSSVFASLGQLLYFSLLKLTDAVVGNSSSGIIEVPSFGIPTVNIGNRQKGRIRARSVIDSDGSESSISESISLALSTDFRASLSELANPYEKDNTAKSIGEQIDRFSAEISTKKRFYEMPSDRGD